MKNKIIRLSDLAFVGRNHPNSKIVHCHGVFDLIHLGHIRHFKSAKIYGDILVISITDDQFVNKGPKRPYNTASDRALMLASLDIVDYVAINPNPNAIKPIEILKPDFYVKGPDYRNKNGDITGGIFKEEEAVIKNGGKLVFTDDETDSSTSILNRFFIDYTDDQMEATENVKAVTSYQEINELIDQLSSLKILVIGEPIIDTYIFTSY